MRAQFDIAAFGSVVGRPADIRELFEAVAFKPALWSDDILTHLIPGTLVNPSMVATVAVLQQVHGYTYAALTF